MLAVGCHGTVGRYPRPIVGVHLSDEGHLVCTKSDGNKWTSAKGGHVDFYLNGAYLGKTSYSPQNENTALHQIKWPNVTNDLGVGSYWGTCIAVPYIDIPPGTEGWVSPQCSPTDAKHRCTVSGTYYFDIAANGNGVKAYDDRCPSCPAWCDPSHPNHKTMNGKQPGRCIEKDYPSACGKKWSCAIYDGIGLNLTCKLAKQGTGYARQYKVLTGYNECVSADAEEWGGSFQWIVDPVGDVVGCPIVIEKESEMEQCCSAEDGCWGP